MSKRKLLYKFKVVEKFE